MKILIIGAGGREHALLDAISKSKKVSKIYVAPGNPGMKDKAEIVNIGVENLNELCEFAKEKNIDMTIVGPEVPLVMGISEVFEKAGLKVLGVNEKCAKFEGSKDFTKEFLMKYDIPTAKYVTFTDFLEAEKNIGIYGYPMVIKADGLAAGKGVIIAENEREARDALSDIMVKKVFGDSKVVIEEFLDGIEASIICLVDGKTIVPLETAKDFKKAKDGDLGLNTGGMGTFSPSNVIDEELKSVIKNTILTPVMNGLVAEKLDYKGILFIGIMIKNGVPKVLEFNVRFGDPETQVILPRLKNDIITVFEAVIEGKLSEISLEWTEKEAVCVVMTAKGYPESYEKGKKITIKDCTDDITVYHAGTKEENGEILTNGGRVLNVVSLSENVEKARKSVYENIVNIDFEGKTYRNDIAKLD